MCHAALSKLVGHQAAWSVPSTTPGLAELGLRQPQATSNHAAAEVLLELVPGALSSYEQGAERGYT